jgi:DNA-binding MarR family transcriptional regulator
VRRPYKVLASVPAFGDNGGRDSGEVMGERIVGERHRIQDSTLYRIHRLARSLFKASTNYYVPRFALGVPEMRVLWVISDNAPLASSEVVDIAAMDKALVSRVMQRLVKSGYVTDSLDPKDHRKRVWTLTKAGHAVVQKLAVVRQARQARVLGCVTVRERKLLNEMLDRLFLASESLRADEAAELQDRRPAPTQRRRKAG